MTPLDWASFAIATAIATAAWLGLIFGIYRLILTEWLDSGKREKDLTYERQRYYRLGYHDASRGCETQVERIK